MAAFIIVGIRVAAGVQLEGVAGAVVGLAVPSSIGFTALAISLVALGSFDLSTFGAVGLSPRGWISRLTVAGKQ